RFIALRTVIKSSIPTLIRTSDFTALVKGGKLNVRVLPLFMVSLVQSSSSFRLRHHRQTAMSRRIHRAYGEYYIILRNLQGCTVRTRYRLGVLPVWAAGRAPDYLVVRSSRRRLPCQIGFVLEFSGDHF